MDVEALLAPVSEDDPVGPDTFDRDDRGVIQATFDRDDAEVDASEWPGIVRGLTGLAKDTRDMWVAIHIMEAGARAGRLETVDEGAQLLAGLVERYWDDVHPKLEDVDFEGRANTCASLTKIRDFLGPLRRTVLFESRLGNFTGEDLEKFSRGEGTDTVGQFRIMLDQFRRENKLEPAAQDLVDRFDSIRDSLRRADKVLTANAGSSTSTNFQPTYEAIESIRKLLVPYAGVQKPAVTDVDDDDTGDDADADAANVARPSTSSRHVEALGDFSGSVASRDDVLRALDAISGYYRTREPTSPMPLLLARARAWVGMSFLDVLADLAPGGIPDARAILMARASGGGSPSLTPAPVDYGRSGAEPQESYMPAAQQPIVEAPIYDADDDEEY